MEYDLTKEEDVVAFMKSSTSYQQWDENADKVRVANNGEYPKFWFEAVVLSGLSDKIASPLGIWTSKK